MRLRPKFSLKMLMLFVAAAGSFCGYHLHWIRQRHELLADLAAQWNAIGSKQPFLEWVHEKTAKSSFNFLWLFGEKQYDDVGIQLIAAVPDDEVQSTSDIESLVPDLIYLHTPEIERAASLFPEADIDFCVYSVERNDMPNEMQQRKE